LKFNIGLLLALLVLVVGASGCTSLGAEKVLGEYNLSSNGTNPINDKDITLPSSTKSVRIEYNNVRVLETPILKVHAGYFRFATYNDAAHREKDIDSKLIHTNKTPLNGNLTLTVDNAKKVRLTAMNSKGTVKVIAII
jgi:hypothetical protein